MIPFFKSYDLLVVTSKTGFAVKSEVVSHDWAYMYSYTAYVRVNWREENWREEGEKVSCENGEDALREDSL